MSLSLTHEIMLFLYQFLSESWTASNHTSQTLFGIKRSYLARSKGRIRPFLISKILTGSQTRSINSMECSFYFGKTDRIRSEPGSPHATSLFMVRSQQQVAVIAQLLVCAVKCSETITHTFGFRMFYFQYRLLVCVLLCNFCFCKTFYALAS